jgi:hypothetical protein
MWRSHNYARIAKAYISGLANSSEFVILRVTIILERGRYAFGFKNGRMVGETRRYQGVSKQVL